MRKIQELEENEDEYDYDDDDEPMRGFQGVIFDFRRRFAQSKKVAKVRSYVTWGYGKSWEWAKFGGKIGFIVATTAMVTIFPLILEIQREEMIMEDDRRKIEDYKNQGYTDKEIRDNFGLQDDTVTPTLES